MNNGIFCSVERRKQQEKVIKQLLPSYPEKLTELEI